MNEGAVYFLHSANVSLNAALEVKVMIDIATRGPHQVNINAGRFKHLKNWPMLSFFFLLKPLNWFLLVFTLTRIIKRFDVQLWKITNTLD